MATEQEIENALEQLELWDINTIKLGIETLYELGGEKAAEYLEPITKLFDHEEDEVRRFSVFAVGEIGPAAASEAKHLTFMFKDKAPAVRAAAAKSLGQIGPKGGKAYGAKVAELAKDADEDVGLAAIACLVAIEDVMQLGPFLDSKFATVIKAAIIAVSHSKPATEKFVDKIMSHVGHSEVAVRCAVVTASGEAGSAATDAHMSALAQLRSTDRQMKVRRAAVQALGKLRPRSCTYLANYFQDSDETLRHLASETMASIGGEQAAEACVNALSLSDPPPRRAALNALGKLKEDGLEHVASIIEFINDTDLECRLAAIQALSELGAASAAQALGALVSDGSKGVRLGATNALAKMGEEGAEQALAFLDDEDVKVRECAVKVFSPLHSKLPADIARLHADSVAGKLADEDWRVRNAACVALGDLKANEHEASLGALNSDDNEGTRRSAVAALVKMGAQPVHVAGFLGDTNTGVRLEAEQAYALLRAGAGADDEDVSDCD